MSTDSTPKVSIVTVNLNHAAGLEKTIESVAGQTFRELEYIVVDGGSTDGSQKVISSFAGKISRHISESDKGIYDAMNKGLSLACGEYIYFLNSGDRLVSPNTLARIFDSTFSDADLLYGDVIRPDSQGKLWECRHPDPLTVAAFFGFGICQQAIFYKRALFEDLGKFDENFKIAGDWDFNLRVLLAGRATRHLNFPVAHYQGGGVSVTKPDLAAQEKERILKRHLPEAVYRDYARLAVLESERGRLKQIEEWVEQIRNRNPLINFAMVSKWALEKWTGQGARGKKGGLE